MAQVSQEKLQNYILALDMIEFRSDGLPYWKESRRGVKCGSVAGSVCKLGYRRICVNGDSLLAHRVSWFICNRFNPTEQLDHIDGNRDNNRISNLRVASNAQNQHNKKISVLNTSGYKGVQMDSGTGNKPFRARIRFEGKRYCLGRFKTAEEAKKAYDEKAIALHKEFYRKG